MSDPMERSMQGTSQFITFQSSIQKYMEKSMCGSSQKIPIENASSVNRIQRQKDMKAYQQIKGNKSIKQKNQQEEENQFLNVGKWNKQRQSQIRKSIQQEQSKSRQDILAKQQKQVKSKNGQNQTKAQAPSSKWEKKKTYDSGNGSLQSSPQLSCRKISDNSAIRQKQVYLTNVKEVEGKNQQKQKVQKIQDQIQQQHIQEHEDQQQLEEQQQQQQEEQSQQQQQEQQQQEEEQQQQEQQEEGDQEQQDEQQGYEQNQQQPTEEEQNQEQQLVEEKFATGATEQFEQSSQAMKTQTVNTSAVNRTPVPTKWGKKKTPLETMTKYEQRKSKIQHKEGIYHSRLNSASNIHKHEQDQIAQDIPHENQQQWKKIEKVLLRLKLLLQ